MHHSIDELNTKGGVSVETPPSCLIFLKYGRIACKARLIPFLFALFLIQMLYSPSLFVWILLIVNASFLKAIRLSLHTTILAH